MKSLLNFLKKELWVYVIIVIIGALYALNYTLFVVPNNFAPSGVSGIAVMIQYKMGFSIGYFTLIVNIPLCIFAFFAIDKKFAIKTFVFSLVYSLVYLVLQNVDIERFKYETGGVDTIYTVIIAGLIGGVGFGVLFRFNASTAGTDIISKYVNKIKPGLNFFWVTFAINAVVAVISYFVYGEVVDGQMVYNYKPVCLCLMYSYISSYIGNKIISGNKQAYRFTIITDQPEDIEKEIITKLQHTATRLVGQGSYSHKDKTVLICLVNKSQMIDCEKIIKKYPGTFSFVEKVSQTYGNFRRLKIDFEE